MKRRGLVVAWGVVVVTVLLLLGYELVHWRALSTQGARAAGERQRLTGEIRLREEQFGAEMRARSAALQELQWAAAEGEPSAFLARLADLAREKRMKVVAVGPLERQTTAQFSKSWYTIQVVAPYREIRELAGRVERDKGILEDLRLEPAPPARPGRPGDGLAPNEVQARFRLTALELSAPARRIVDHALAPDGRAPASPAAGSTPGAGVGAPLARDPFVFGVGQVPFALGTSEVTRPGKSAGTPPPAPPRR